MLRSWLWRGLLGSGAVVCAMIGAASNASALCVVGVAPGDSLRIRGGPGVDYRTVGSIPRNVCSVSVLGPCRGPWCQVSWRGSIGWSNTAFLGWLEKPVPRSSADARSRRGRADARDRRKQAPVRDKVAREKGLGQVQRKSAKSTVAPAVTRQGEGADEPALISTVVPNPLPLAKVEVEPRAAPQAVAPQAVAPQAATPRAAAPAGPAWGKGLNAAKGSAKKDWAKKDGAKKNADTISDRKNAAVAAVPSLTAPAPEVKAGGVKAGGVKAGSEVCVSGIDKGDTLKVRAGPGNRFALRYGYIAGTCGVKITGDCKSGWCPVDYRGYAGWALQRNLQPKS